LYGQYRLPFVTVPYFINAGMYDSFQLLYDLGGATPTGTGQVYFADSFANATRAALAPALAAGQGVFSTSCLLHCLTDNSTLYVDALANGRSVVQTLAAWYWGGAGPAQAVSDCVNYPCVGDAASCPGGPQTYGLSQAVVSQEVLDAHGGAPTATSSEQARAAMEEGAQGKPHAGWIMGFP
jgi:hypothetical protein